MTGTRTVALALLTGAAVAPGAACVDLFHSTDFETLCGLDAAACPGEAGAGDARPDAAPLDFCALDGARARSMAEHACAWLGACEVPFDENAFGACMVRAILAFDCAANPNQTIAAGPLHDLWQALGTAASCADVQRVVNPKDVGCGTTGFGCAGKTDPAVAVECVAGKGGAESCLVQGRVCGGAGLCEPEGAASSCKTSTCKNSVLHDCESGADVGYDCARFGAGACVSSSVGPTCQPSFPMGATSSCAATFDVTCSGDKATTCPTLQSVSVDCKALDPGATCKAGKPSPLWNVAGQCRGPGCTDGCEGSDTLKGCAQGIAFTTSCKKEGLGSCAKVPLPAGATGYACKSP